jgi:putative ABC transport system permease protein
MPWQISNELRERRGRFARAVGRLKPGVTFEQAQNDNERHRRAAGAAVSGFDTNWGATVVPLRTQFTGEIRKPLLILLGAVGFVLRLPAPTSRTCCWRARRLVSVRIALRAGLGASRWRIARQLLTESVVLSFFGGAFGLLLLSGDARVACA